MSWNVCVVEELFCVCLGCVEGEGCVDQVGIYDEPGGKSYRGMLPEHPWTGLSVVGKWYLKVDLGVNP